MQAITDVARAFGLSVSALRYYDDIGLVPATERRGRVRFYDDTALRRLTYALLWLRDGELGVRKTSAVLDADTSGRDEMLADLQRRIVDRVRALETALEMLEHIADCRVDDFNDCSIISGYLDGQAQAMIAAAQHLDAREAPALGWSQFRNAAHRSLSEEAP